MEFCEGYSVDGDDMHWKINCPSCNKEIEYEGFFDATDEYKCPKCKEVFYCNKVWLNENQFIK